MTEGLPPDHGKPAGITADIAAIVAADIAAAVSAGGRYELPPGPSWTDGMLLMLLQMMLAGAL